MPTSTTVAYTTRIEALDVRATTGTTSVRGRRTPPATRFVRLSDPLTVPGGALEDGAGALEDGTAALDTSRATDDAATDAHTVLGELVAVTFLFACLVGAALFF